MLVSSTVSYLPSLFNEVVGVLPSCFLNLLLKTFFVCISESQDVSCWECNANSTLGCCYISTFQDKNKLDSWFSSVFYQFFHVMCVWISFQSGEEALFTDCVVLWLTENNIIQYCRNGAVRPGDRKIFCCTIAKKMVISQIFLMFWMLFFGHWIVI